MSLLLSGVNTQRPRVVNDELLVLPDYSSAQQNGVAVPPPILWPAASIRGQYGDSLNVLLALYRETPVTGNGDHPLNPLSGIAYGASGSPLANATIDLFDNATDAFLTTTTTDAAGNWKLGTPYLGSVYAVGHVDSGAVAMGATDKIGIATGATKYIVLTITGAGQWHVPADWNPANNKIECIGGGGASCSASATPAEGTGAGGGAYARKSNVPLIAGMYVEYSVGIGGAVSQQSGGDTWFGPAARPWALAKGGQGGQTNAKGLGGAASACSGDVVYSGGNGGTFLSNGASGEGGGGAGGPNGAGAKGGTRSSGDGCSGGGGSGGGSAGADSVSTSGGIGGDNFSGSGHGTAGASQAGGAGSNGGGGGGASTGVHSGGNGGNGIDFADGAHGAGGGGGGATGPTNGSGGFVCGNGGLYGGGGAGGGGGGDTQIGTGGQGIVFITYTPITWNQS